MAFQIVFLGKLTKILLAMCYFSNSFSMWKKKIRSLLKETLSPLRAEEGKKISLRGLSTAIGISPGALSEIITGKRKLSERSALQILEALDLNAETKEDLKNLIVSQSKGKRELLAKEAEVLVSEWFFSSILCLFELLEPPKNEEEISTRLGVPPDKIQWAVQLLMQHGLLTKTNDHLVHTGHYWTTTDEIPSESVKQAHRNELHLSEQALRKIPVEQRDFTAITFSGNSKQLEQVKRELRRFRDRIANIIAEGDCDHVYKLNIQFFPVDGWELGQTE